ncbi:MAG: DUF4105 domain-containing protein, partial [Owenweeksia sp.]
MKKALWLLTFLPLFASAQWQLSPKAEIHVLTCGPYQGELYSAFGHSAVRVYDPQNGIDFLYNYGVFDYDQPNFYLNFARGFLNYQLDVMAYDRFKAFYIEEDRYIHEQVLNLSPEEKQEFFDFLQWNARPDNKYYSYDYFYDNCATRIRDALANVLGERLQFEGDYITIDYSIRDLCDIYLQYQPWGDLGIDLCLGLPMDKKATPYEYMFLPDYLESGLNHAYLYRDGVKRPLVKETIITYSSRDPLKPRTFFTPIVFTSLILLIGLFITYRAFRKKKNAFGFDTFLMSITGLLGWFLLALWLATDHKAAACNFNLLWAFPLYFPMALLLLKKRRPAYLRLFFRLTFWIHLITLLIWPWWP